MSIFEVAHWSGIVPVVALVAARTAGRRAPAAYWWVAAGFAVSVPADAVQKLTGGGFEVTHLYLPAQVTLVVWGLEHRAFPRLATLLAVGVVAYASAALSPGTDWLLTVAGSVFIMGWALDQDRLVWPLFAYFGAGSAAYLWMLPLIGSEAIYPRWLLYQACRWVAFALFAWAALRRDEP